jgi:Tol biopolymer transport system component
VVFVADTPGQASAVWIVPAAGGTPRELAAGPGALFVGAADPQGTHAVAVSAEEGQAGHRETLWLVSLADGARTQLSPADLGVRSPAWSPDGAFLVFERGASMDRDLYRVARTGGPPTRLTRAPHGSFEPNVSADGRHIVFGTSRDGRAEVYRMGADGSHPQRLTHQVRDDVRPRHQPKGTSIAWLSYRGGEPAVWLMQADGTHKRALSPDARRRVVDYAWSPDGTRIAVVKAVSTGNTDIDLVEVASGTTLGTLASPGVDEQPSWSPDGRSLVFSSTRTGDAELYRWDGSSPPVRFTERPGADWLPRWVAGP